MDDSVITCNEIIEEEIKTFTTNFNEKKQSVNIKFLYFTCLFINQIALLIPIIIYC